MDPITATIVAGVLWFFLGSFGSIVIYLLGLGLGILTASLTDKEGWAVMGVVIGWIASVAWYVFVIVQVVLHIVHLIQLSTGA